MAIQLGDCLLREWITKSNMSQAEFARQMECSPQYVSALINNKERMSLEFAINAAALLNCSVNDFYKVKHVRSRIG